MIQVWVVETSHSGRGLGTKICGRKSAQSFRLGLNGPGIFYWNRNNSILLVFNTEPSHILSILTVDLFPKEARHG